MEYDYQSRQKLVEDFKRNWNRQLLLLDKRTKAQAEEIEKGDYLTSQGKLFDIARSKLREEKASSYSEFMKKHFKKLTMLYVGEAYISDYYYMIDKRNQFPYSKGLYRRTVRTKCFFPQIEHVFQLLKDYQVFQFFDCSIADYLRNTMTPEKLDYKRNPIYGFSMNHFDEIITAAES